MSLSRREMMKKTAGTAAVAGAALAAGHALLREQPVRYPANRGPWPEPAEARLIRPPGALDEPDFLAACIRCYKCQDACEPGAIQFFTEAAGPNYHSPYVDPAVKGCTLCMKCTEVCPTGALRPMDIKQKAEVDMATVELREDLCLSYKAQRIRNEQAMMMELGEDPTEATEVDERRGPCGACFTFCPLKNRAIKLEPGAFLAPIVFEDHCVGCGMCEEICRVMVRGTPAIRVVPTRGVTEPDSA